MNVHFSHIFFPHNCPQDHLSVLTVGLLLYGPSSGVTETLCVQMTWSNTHLVPSSGVLLTPLVVLQACFSLLFSFMSHLFNQLEHNPHRLICWFIYLKTFNLKCIQSWQQNNPTIPNHPPRLSHSPHNTGCQTAFNSTHSATSDHSQRLTKGFTFSFEADASMGFWTSLAVQKNSSAVRISKNCVHAQ